MTPFKTSVRAYETWLRGQLPDLVVEADLKKKHQLMKGDAFTFLRATCWRWAELADHLCPAFADAPVVAAIGDAHIENFGLWRDREARLVWGANDFDEAARTPYAYDLIRLGASALLARAEKIDDAVMAAILSGYRAGLKQPEPFVLERDRPWLRDLFAVSERRREAYWAAFDKMRAQPAPPAVEEALQAALPPGAREVKIWRRVAGAGSLGRMRFVAYGKLHGAPIAREAKALAASCWTRTRVDAALPDPLALAFGPHRAADPILSVHGQFLLRRLGPNSRKLERRGGVFPLKRRLLRAMGGELANIHAASSGAVEAIEKDLAKRNEASFAQAAASAAHATMEEWRAYATS